MVMPTIFKSEVCNILIALGRRIDRVAKSTDYAEGYKDALGDVAYALNQQDNVSALTNSRQAGRTVWGPR